MADCVIIEDVRSILFDFLIGAHNRKSANQIHQEQTWKDRVTFNYIPAHLKRYQREFAFHHRFYMLYAVSMIPQYLVLIGASICLAVESRYVFYGFGGIRLLILIALRAQVDSSRQSRYAKKPGKRRVRHGR